MIVIWTLSKLQGEILQEVCILEMGTHCSTSKDSQDSHHISTAAFITKQRMYQVSPKQQLDQPKRLPEQSKWISCVFIVENLTPTNCKSVVNNRNGSTSSDMTCFVLIVLDTIRSHSANQGVTAVIVTAATTPVYVTVPPVHRNHRLIHHADC